MNDILDSDLERIIITTAPTVANKEIDYEMDIITAECVFGMNIFRDLFAGIRDIFGGRSEAYELGADAVIGVDLDYQEFSGKGKGMLFLVASGTAVKLRD